MEEKLLEIITSQQETIRLLSLELAGITNALGSIITQQMNPIQEPMRLNLSQEPETLEDPLPSTAGGLL